MTPKLPNAPPWWANLICIFAFICTAVFGYNEIFPNPQVTQLHEEFKVHEATPAHGMEKIQEMQIIQVIIMDDLREVEQDVSAMRNEQQKTNKLLHEIAGRIR